MNNTIGVMYLIFRLFSLVPVDSNIGIKLYLNASLLKNYNALVFPGKQLIGIYLYKNLFMFFTGLK